MRKKTISERGLKRRMRGEIYEYREYTPYGETWVNEGRDSLDRIEYMFTGKELDEETGLYYFGARYLDPTTSRWLSVDPALGEYMPIAPVSDDAKKHNGNLPGMGGVYNPVNLAMYHYGNNNPIKYIDPDGKDVILIGFSGTAGIGVGATVGDGIFISYSESEDLRIGLFQLQGIGTYIGMGGGVAGEISFSFADSADDVMGTGVTIGGSGTVYGCLSAGGEITFQMSGNLKAIVFTTFVGVGASPVPGEGHIFVGNTNIISEIDTSKFSIKNLEKLKTVCEKLAKEYIIKSDGTVVKPLDTDAIARYYAELREMLKEFIIVPGESE